MATQIAPQIDGHKLSALVFDMHSLSNAWINQDEHMIRQTAGIMARLSSLKKYIGYADFCASANRLMKGWVWGDFSPKGDNARSLRVVLSDLAHYIAHSRMGVEEEAFLFLPTREQWDAAIAAGWHKRFATYEETYQNVR